VCASGTASGVHGLGIHSDPFICCILYTMCTGSGSYGSVYRAVFRGTTVAVKFIKLVSRNKTAGSAPSVKEGIQQLQDDCQEMRDFSREVMLNRWVGGCGCCMWKCVRCVYHYVTSMYD